VTGSVTTIGEARVDRRRTDRERVASDQEPLQLGDYPRVAACASCHQYARQHRGKAPALAVLAATLAHHDGGHVEDLLTLASEHFA
jgi:hypothetical protein